MNPDPVEEVLPTEMGNRYKVQVDIRGNLAGLEYDHVLVADTLSHYASGAIPQGDGYEAKWEMSYCCEEEKENPEVFQWWAEYGFSHPGDRLELLNQLMETDMLDVEFTDFQEGTLVGIVHARLPIPGQENVLDLPSMAFNFRTTLG